MSLIAEQYLHQHPITDRQLRGLSFRYHDPENAIHKLNRGRPDRSRAIEVIGYYDETPPGGRKDNPDAPFIWCCHCGKPTHWKGYVIRDDVGTTYIIGAENCGRDHYGVHFEDAESRFKNQQSRQQALRRWDVAVSRAPALAEAVEALLRSEELAAVERVRGDIRRASPQCAALLTRHAKTKSRLVLHHKARDHEAERIRIEKYELAVRAFHLLPPALRREQRDNGLDPQLDDSPIFKSWAEDLGELEGSDFLIEEDDVRILALKLRQEINDLMGLVAQGTDGVLTSALNRQVRSITDHASDIFARCTRLSYFHLFFAPANINRLVRWSAYQDEFSISAGDGRTMTIKGTRQQQLIVPPSWVEFPNLEPFANFSQETE